MSTRQPAQTQFAGHRTSFFQQREALVNEIALSFENVLQNINKLNRSLEGVIAVGNEFGTVEALWSQFEGVMAQEPGDGKDGEEKGHEDVRGNADGDNGVLKAKREQDGPDVKGKGR